MRILYLAHCCPFPPHKGDRIRVFHILKYLGARHEVDLVYPSFCAADMAQRERLTPYCRTVRTVYLSPLAARLRCCAALLGGRSFTEAYYSSSDLRLLAGETDCDVVLADCSSMASLALRLDKPRVLDFVDVDSDKWRAFAERSAVPHSWVYGLEARRLRRLEIEACEQFDACLVVSEHERALLPECRHAMVVPNGVDASWKSIMPSPDRPTLIFTGAMDYLANVDAVTQFHASVFPLVKRAVPDVRFLIVGMNPSPAVRNLEGPDTEVTGEVPSVAEYFARASVCVAPLRIARGIQNKVLEAMAAGVPVVATAAANHGINASHGKEILIAENPRQFADAVVALLTDPTAAARLAAEARALVAERFDWERNLERLAKTIELVAGQWHGRSRAATSTAWPARSLSAGGRP